MSLVILTTRKTIGPFDIKERKPKMPGVTKYTVWKGDSWEKDFGRYSAAVRWCRQQCPREVPHVIVSMIDGNVANILASVPMQVTVVKGTVEEPTHRVTAPAIVNADLVKRVLGYITK